MFSPQKNKKRFFAGAYWGSYIREERGFVLVLTLMLISLMSVLAITSFELVTSTTRITSNHKLYLQALYVADAGVEDTLCVLSKAGWGSLVFDPETPSSLSTLSLDTIDVNWVWNGVDEWSLSKSDLGGTYAVTLTMDAGDAGDTSDDRLVLESTGTISGFTKVIVAEIGRVPSAKITLWMEKEI
jgi:Tfp pilus assembly protein PilX